MTATAQVISPGVLDQLHPAEILLAHLEALERRDFIELEQHVALERVGNPALDEGDRDQPLALGDGHHLVHRVRRIDDRLARLKLEAEGGVAERDMELAAVIIPGVVEEERAAKIAADGRALHCRNAASAWAP